MDLDLSAEEDVVAHQESEEPFSGTGAIVLPGDEDSLSDEVESSDEEETAEVEDDGDEEEEEADGAIRPYSQGIYLLICLKFINMKSNSNRM